MNIPINRRSQPAYRNSLLALASLSGAASLAYEVLYLRVLTTALGDMFYVHATLLAVFLFGLGLGARLARRCLRHLYAFELLTGLYALALPTLARATPASALYGLFSDPAAATASSAVLLLAVPAVAIGFSVPLFAEYVKRATPKGSAFELTYALYNLGAFAGVLAVELILIRSIGISRSLYLLGALNILIGAALLHGKLRPAEGYPEEVPHPHVVGARPPAAAKSPAKSALRPNDLYALALAAFAAAVFQGFYLKLCYHLFLPHRENFALCTATALLAVAAGAWLVRRFRLAFADCALYAALSLALIYALFPPLVKLYHLLHGRLPGAGAVIVLKIFFAVLLGGLPMTLLGATVPALLRKEDSLARDSGTLLFASGTANALGLLAFVFILHPLLPLFSCVPLAAALLAAAAALQAGPAFYSRRILSAAAAAALLCRAGTWPENIVYAMNAGPAPGARVVTIKHASDNATLIIDENRTALTYNGHPGITLRRRGVPNRAEALEGLLAAVVAPKTDYALVLGLGAGITAGAAAHFFDETDVVEINKAFFPLMDLVKDEQYGLAEQPGVRLYYDDGRRFLARSQHKGYDAIINTLPAPAYFSAGKLYTSAFFSLVNNALAPGGVYLTWFTFGDMSNAGVDTLLATLAGSFRHCGLSALREGYYLLACSDAPLKRKDLSQRLPPPALINALEGKPRVAPLDGMVEALWLSDDVFAGAKRPAAALNTDDFPRLEFEIMRQGPGRRRSDAVARDPQRFALRPFLGKDPGAVVIRALVLLRDHGSLFRSRVWPVMKKDRNLRQSLMIRLLLLQKTDPQFMSETALLEWAKRAERSGEDGLAARFCGEALDKNPLSGSAAGLMRRLTKGKGDESTPWLLRQRALGG